jgi:hypothetical protein
MPLYGDPGSGPVKVKDLFLGSQKIKEAHLWDGGAWKKVYSSGFPVLFQEPFSTVVANLANAPYVGWIDRAYSTAVFPVDANGLTSDSTTERSGNIYYYEVPSKGFYDSWATVEVTEVNSVASASVGVALRADAAWSTIISFSNTQAFVRWGPHNVTTVATTLATHTLDTPLAVGDVIGGMITGTYTNATAGILRNGKVIATFSGLDFTSTGGFPGVALSRGSAHVKNFKSGPVTQKTELYGTLSANFTLSSNNTYMDLPMVTDNRFGSGNTNISNNAIVVPETGEWRAEFEVRYGGTNGTQRGRLMRNNATVLEDTESSANTPSRAGGIINLVAGDLITWQALRTNQVSSSHVVTPASTLRLVKV